MTIFQPQIFFDLSSNTWAITVSVSCLFVEVTTANPDPCGSVIEGLGILPQDYVECTVTPSGLMVRCLFAALALERHRLNYSRL